MGARTAAICNVAGEEIHVVARRQPILGEHPQHVGKLAVRVAHNQHARTYRSLGDVDDRLAALAAEPGGRARPLLKDVEEQVVQASLVER